MKNFLFFWICFFVVSGSADADDLSFLWEDLTVNLPDSPLRSFAVDPQDPRRIFAATARGIWKSDDGGKKWEQQTGALEYRWVAPQEVKDREARSLVPFLRPGDGERLFASGDFLAEAKRRILEEKTFSGPTCIAIHPQNTLRLFAGTFDGVLVSEDGGRNWERRRPGVSADEGAVLFVAVSRHDPQKIYAATMGGLFISWDGGKKWKKARGEPADEAVACVLEDPENPKKIWVGTVDDGVYASSDDGKHWIHLSVGVGPAGNHVRSLALRRGEAKRELFAATDEGLYCSTDEKLPWLPCSRGGPMGNLLAWVIAPANEKDQIAVAGERGVFGSADGGKTFRQWSVGLRFQNALQLAEAGDGGTLFFVTPLGLFQSVRQKSAEKITAATEIQAAAAESPLWRRFQHEPSVQEVQRQAMRFAETHPEKIIAWRRGAKWRALLPKFQLGLDKTHTRKKQLDSETSQSQKSSQEYNFNNDVTDDEEAITAVTFNGKRQIPTHTHSVSTEESGSYDTANSSSFSGSLTSDRKNGIELGAVWDLGNFLFNPDEVDISKEARAIAELRDNILKEVTQFYFRRRHLQIELLAEELAGGDSSPEKSPTDPLEQARKQLELEELTAQIDAFTGGWFSRQLGTPPALKPSHLRP